MSDNNSSNCYADVPLETGTRLIRLVRLVSTGSPDTIECELRPFLLDSVPEYRALSYTWGENSNERLVIMNNVPFAVRQNLWAFLQQERNSEEAEWYWIDAICINQSSISEKNHQVALMREIYGLASVVIVWLGPATKVRDEAMEAMKNVIRAVQSDDHVDPEQVWTWRQKQSVLCLCSESYWRRAWIVQEIMLAQRIAIRCGASWIDWPCLYPLVSWLESLPGTLLNEKSIMESEAIRIITGKMTWPAQKFDNKAVGLNFFLMKYQIMESTDIRDRVFSFVGLLDHTMIENHEIGITVDYSLSTSELFQRVHDIIRESSPDLNTVHFVATLANILNLSIFDEVVRQAVLQIPKGYLSSNILEEHFSLTQQSQLETVEMRRAIAFWDIED